MPKLLSTLSLCAALLVALFGSSGVGQGAAPPTPAEAKLSKAVLQAIAANADTEFLVVLAEQADLSHAATLTTKEAKGRYVYETLVATAQRTQKPLREWLATRGATAQSFYIVNMLLVRGNRDLALDLAARPEVARIAANSPMQNALPDVAPLQSENQTQSPSAVEPNVAYVNADDVWELGFRGQGIVVAGADTGYAWQHPSLQPHYRGWDEETETADHDYNWHDSIHENAGTNRCGADSPEPCDDGTHGSHTMGTLVGADGGANETGVAPEAEWIGCRNMDNGSGTAARYTECFEFFLAPYPIGADPMEDGNPDLAPDVTNNSWTCTRPFEGEDCDTPDELQAVVEAQRAAGIFTVVAAGNSGSACSTVLFPPAIYDAAYTVGNLDMSTGQLASGSSRGPVTIDGSNRIKPDLAAPGTGIRSTTSEDGYGASPTYGLSGGTSMAAPHVAGAVALILSARPDLRGDIDAIEGYLNLNATPLTTSACNSTGTPNNWYGYGGLDVLASVEAALEAPTSIYLTTVQVNTPVGAQSSLQAIVSLTLVGGVLAAVGSWRTRQKR